ncbi:LysR family transcriptional regulator [Noviherbaspirillum denitrificans]|uniref:LysR family transcriptional regulator n=1 Tax=Noviherbaspirillum denitrificans TaxID=1968433 RepID=A0A254TKE2_9BURK|nr:LysR family transcriptional regulator [Noviherbaspirillum denitrificans]OWW21073.1 LysR family transcriptional regulator [Noviherbaspirillum denitrificans]
MKSSYAKMQSILSPADLELVLALARGRSLQGAAERLRVDTSTVFRSIKRIEKDLGALLFERGRQGYLPTELGRELAGYAERIETQLQEAREVAARGGSEPAGALRITTTDTVLNGLLLPVLGRFTAEYPQVELELIATNTLANLSQRDADVAIRATRKPPEHLVGSHLGSIPSAVYASQDYVDRMDGRIDLETADWIALDESLADHPSVRWRRQRFPKVQPRYRCNSVLSVAGSVVWGLGIGVAPMFLLRDHPQARVVEGPVAELEAGLWMLAHPDIRHLKRVKLLFDFLREHVRM